MMGLLSFGPHGHVTFASLTSALTINGVAYTLVNSVAGLAAANPASAVALASNYDARADVVYTKAPVYSYFTGYFEGLGNTISELRIRSLLPEDNVGLFAELDGGSISNLILDRVHVSGVKFSHIGGLAGTAYGRVQSVTVSGQIDGREEVSAGGLAGVAAGTFDTCSSNASVTVGAGSVAGGLVGDGQSPGTATRVFATGPVSGGESSALGGLIGGNTMSLSNSYASGAVTGGPGSYVGGLIEFSNGSISTSYASGAVSSQAGSEAGGFSGFSFLAMCSACYWDTTTSGTPSGVAGQNEPDVQPLTTSQFQAGLPDGFDSSVWAESPAINGGLPYLLAKPPR